MYFSRTKYVSKEDENMYFSRTKYVSKEDKNMYFSRIKVRICQKYLFQ